MELARVDYASQIGDLVSHLSPPGLLLVARDTERPANVMTIGWATFGRVWGQPMCVVFVRPSRYTFDLINRADAFTVNRMPAGLEEAVQRCGTASGREVDKFAREGWTVGDGITQDAPFIAEAALHLECRKVFIAQVTAELAPALLAECYPRGDFHTIYFGQVTGAFRHE